LAALIFVSFDDLFLFHLLAGAGIVRSKHDPRCGAGVIFRFLIVISAEVVVGLLVPIGFDGFRLVVGLEGHIGKSTTITIVAPPAGSEYGIKAIGAFT